MPLSTDNHLSNILRIGKNLKKGAKILTLKQPNYEIMKSMKDIRKKEDIIDTTPSSSASEFFENFERETVLSANVREEHFYLEKIVWCKMSWGRARVYVLVRNSTI